MNVNVPADAITILPLKVDKASMANNMQLVLEDDYF